MLYWNFNILAYCTLNVACSRYSSGEVGGHPSPDVSPMATQSQSLYPQQGDQAPPLKTSESSCLVLRLMWSSSVLELCVWFASTRCVCEVCPCCVWRAAHPICTDAQCSIHDCMIYYLCFHSAIEEGLYSSQFYH